jgi:hypothetical protein
LDRTLYAYDEKQPKPRDLDNPQVWNRSRAEFDIDYSRTGKRLDWTVRLPLGVSHSGNQVGERTRSSSEEAPSPIDFDDPINQMRFTFWRLALTKNGHASFKSLAPM